MNQYEEELQNNIERGLTHDGDDLDAKAYREIFRALQKEPGYELRSRFAQNVVAKIVAKQRREQSRDYFWFFAGLFVLFIASLATIIATGFRLDFGFLKTMADYKGLAGFAVVFIILLNWLDKRLVREKLMQNG